MDLPRVIPIFALPNVVLFPGVPLPLHVFEPRYRQMIADAAAGHELIGMTLLRGDWRKSYYAQPEIFAVGCAGRIVNVEALADGRSNVLLHGICEFDVETHLFDGPYRQAEVDWWSRGKEPLPSEIRAALVSCLRPVVDSQPKSRAHRLLDDPTLPDEQLVNFFSYMLDLPPLEKQGLLQEKSLIDRARRLTEVLEFQVAESTIATVADSAPRRDH